MSEVRIYLETLPSKTIMAALCPVYSICYVLMAVTDVDPATSVTRGGQMFCVELTYRIRETMPSGTGAEE